MSHPTLARPRAADRIAPVALAAGITAVLAGFSLGLLGQPGAAVVLRWLGTALLAVFALRRPSLMTWTFLAMLAGIEVGLDLPQVARQTRWIGDLFLRLIRMIVAPLLLATITTGIAGHSQLRSVGRVAVKALLFFEVVTTLGLLIGLVAMNLSGAGWGVHLPETMGAAAHAVQPPQDWQQLILNIFPENIAQAVAQNQILEVAVFSIFFGTGLALLPESGRAPLVTVLRSLAEVMFKITRMVMYVAPAAAGAAIAYTVGSTGPATLLALGKLVLTFYVALAAFCLLVLLPTFLLFRIPLRAFLRAIGEPAAIGFATSSSEAALPLAMERMEEFGVPRWIASFVIPTGYSFNMTGSSLYVSMAAVFVAQAGGIHLGVGRQIAILAVLMLASKGVAGVPRSVLVVLMAAAGAVGLPTAPILLILGVDTLIDMGRAMMNVFGNAMASAVIARTEGTRFTPA